MLYSLSHESSSCTGWEFQLLRSCYIMQGAIYTLELNINCWSLPKCCFTSQVWAVPLWVGMAGIEDRFPFQLKPFHDSFQPFTPGSPLPVNTFRLPGQSCLKECSILQEAELVCSLSHCKPDLSTNANFETLISMSSRYLVLHVPDGFATGITCEIMVKTRTNPL